MRSHGIREGLPRRTMRSSEQTQWLAKGFRTQHSVIDLRFALDASEECAATGLRERGEVLVRIGKRSNELLGEFAP